jgi:hypothetical protein
VLTLPAVAAGALMCSGALTHVGVAAGGVLTVPQTSRCTGCQRSAALCVISCSGECLTSWRGAP